MNYGTPIPPLPGPPNLTAGPLVAGGTVAAAKYFLVSPSSQDTISQDILLAGGSKLVGDKISDAALGYWYGR